jgi:hypothetical protein
VNISGRRPSNPLRISPDLLSNGSPPARKGAIFIAKKFQKSLVYSTVLCYNVLYIEGVFLVAVPESVRKVPRPVNTIVQDNGKDGPNRYPVRERVSVTYVSGGNPQPKNGKVIGHIVDGVYVPLDVASVKAEPDMLSYGACAFVRSVSRDLFTELLGVYTPKDAYTIMAIASLRVIKPEVSAKRLATQYQQSFISRFYPGIGLSENTVSAFLQGIGRDGNRRLAFYHIVCYIDLLLIFYVIIIFTAATDNHSK